MATNAASRDIKHDADTIAAEWATKASSALAAADIDAFLDCIDIEGWLKDIMTFKWEMTARRGPEAIRSYLVNVFSEAQISGLKIESTEFGRPQLGTFLPGQGIVSAAFTFETPKTLGQGFVRILLPKDGASPKALTVMFMLKNWKGREEASHESGLYGGHTLTWQEVHAKRRAEIEEDPHVIIVGAGQTGLQTAARFRQMGIKALVLEKNAHVGDTWRLRYPTLALHTPKAHHQFLYQPYPSNWPEFTCRDKLAYWMESYAENQDLVIWTSSYPMPTPKYIAEEKRWNVTVNHNGTLVNLRPAHIVLATSLFGDPIIPNLPGSESFGGEIIHTEGFKGGELFVGKRVVVVGSGNSSADICQDLVFRGASSVTMIQRSPTAVVSDKLLKLNFSSAFPPTKPIEYSDLAFQGLPTNALRKLSQDLMPWAKQFDKEMLEGLEKAGFKVSFGPDNSGQLLMVFDRGGGYFIDVGCAELIINGQVKVKYGSEVDHLGPSKIVLKDGTELDADSVILATGWKSARTKLRGTFGDDVIDRTHEVWGTDEYGEIRAGYKPSGQPGLWYATGDFHFSRYMSRQLGLFIQAIELGYYTQ